MRSNTICVSVLLLLSAALTVHGVDEFLLDTTPTVEPTIEPSFEPSTDFSVEPSMESSFEPSELIPSTRSPSFAANRIYYVETQFRGPGMVVSAFTAGVVNAFNAQMRIISYANITMAENVTAMSSFFIRRALLEESADYNEEEEEEVVVLEKTEELELADEEDEEYEQEYEPSEKLRDNSSSHSPSASPSSTPSIASTQTKSTAVSIDSVLIYFGTNPLGKSADEVSSRINTPAALRALVSAMAAASSDPDFRRNIMTATVTNFVRSTPNKKSDDDTLDAGAIAGAVIGSIVGCCLIVAGVVFGKRCVDGRRSADTNSA